MRTAGPRPWTHRLAILLAAATLLLIVVGGGVTTLRAGDTEPSWSLAFWEWFQPPSRLLEKEGHIWEMSHRQLGTLVGFLAIALVVLLARNEPRPWVRKAGYLAFAGIVAQGVLGGIRVLVVSDQGDAVRSALEVENAAGAQALRYLFALLHAGLAYLLFALLVCLAWLTSRRWRDARVASEGGAGRGLRRRCMAVSALIFGQLLVGAYLRHALVWSTGKVVLHVAGALAVGLATAWLAFELFTARSERGGLERPVLYFLLLVQLQIFLGILAFLTGTGSHTQDFAYAWIAILQTAHQVVGPLLFASSAVLVLETVRSDQAAPS